MSLVKRVLSVTLLLLTFAVAASAQQRDAMLQFQLSDQLKKSAARWNVGDLDGFLNDYIQSDELTFTSGGQILKGFEALDRRYRKSYGESAQSMGQLSFSDLEVWTLGPSQALVLGRWRLQREQATGEKVDEGVFTLVMVKIGDHWKILHDHTSAAK
jgi:L-asparaginase / beta-aspartyl-peptidase